MKGNKLSFLSIILLLVLTACSPSASETTATSIPSISTALVTETPIPTATATPIPTATETEIPATESGANIVTQEYMGHDIKFEMEQSYLETNEGTVAGIMDALLGALIVEGGEYGGKFANVEDFVKWIYSDENPDGPGNLRFQRPVDDPSFVHQQNAVDNKVVWEEQPVWNLDNGIMWETDFNVKRVAAGEGKPETPSWRNKEVMCAAIVDEQNRLHMYAAQEQVAYAMSESDDSAWSGEYLQDIPTYCLSYFQVLAHQGDGESALIEGYTATSFPTLRQRASTWFNYNIDWGKE
jgi:hypothetical protein